MLNLVLTTFFLKKKLGGSWIQDISRAYLWAVAPNFTPKNWQFLSLWQIDVLHWPLVAMRATIEVHFTYIYLCIFIFFKKFKFHEYVVQCSSINFTGRWWEVYKSYHLSIMHTFYILYSYFAINYHYTSNSLLYRTFIYLSCTVYYYHKYETGLKTSSKKDTTVLQEARLKTVDEPVCRWISY